MEGASEGCVEISGRDEHTEIEEMRAAYAFDGVMLSLDEEV
jgi:hypothetical protein